MAYKSYENPKELRKLQLLSVEILKEFDRVCSVLEIPYFIYSGTNLGAIRHGGFIPWDDDIDVGMLRADYDRFMREAPSLIEDRFEVLDPFLAPGFPACNGNLALKGTFAVPEEFANCKFQYPISIGIYAFDNLIEDERLYKKQVRSTWLWGRLSFLCATGSPHLNLTGVKRVLALGACQLVHGLLKLIGASTATMYKHWMSAATRYNNVATNHVADFMDRNPRQWSASLDELFPTVPIQFENITVQMPNGYDAILRREYGDYMQLPPEKDRKNHYPSRLDFGPY